MCICVSRCATLRVEGLIKYNVHCVNICGAGGRAVGWLTALQARKSRVCLFADGLLGIFTDLILPVALWFLGSTPPLKHMSAANTSLW